MGLSEGAPDIIVRRSAIGLSSERGVSNCKMKVRREGAQVLFDKVKLTFEESFCAGSLSVCHRFAGCRCKTWNHSELYAIGKALLRVLPPQGCTPCLIYQGIPFIHIETYGSCRWVFFVKGVFFAVLIGDRAELDANCDRVWDI